ncbi:uncharacterized protein LOC133283575 [Gastrolobium bilobum]|uniref:uncharacterized protein LOC133283575 n=1 Tax=Gastrolobium bilobum TaxID=150636 RepID=UPI002AB2200C|nr:uncharacterized protein LOC133283575 [Gastrolobium bilobum]
MNKFIWVILLLLITVAVADHDSDHDHEHHKDGPCGKFSTERMLTHKLRHCKKTACDEWAPVSAECCKEVGQVSIPCMHAIFSSDAFKKVGVNPQVAITIPARCHHVKVNP